MSILSTSDFEDGRYRIALNPEQDADLQIQIDFVENYYLKRLFGIELYDLFVLDLAAPVVGEPTDPRFVKIFNSFDFQDTDEFIYTSEGIKQMLKGFTYFFYLRDLNDKVGTASTLKTKSANSKNTSAWFVTVSRYNQAIESYRVMQLFMNDFDSANYPEYRGTWEDIVHPY